MQSWVRHQILFTLGMLSFGILEVLAAYVWVGSVAAEGAAYTILLCLIPGWLTIYASTLIKHKELGVYVTLFGTGLRIAFVLLGMMALSTIRQDLGFREFVVWLIPSYLVALGLETGILLMPNLTPVAKQAEV